MDWRELERLPSSNLTAIGKATFHHTRLLNTLFNMTLNTPRDVFFVAIDILLPYVRRWKIIEYMHFCKSWSINNFATLIVNSLVSVDFINQINPNLFPIKIGKMKQDCRGSLLCWLLVSVNISVFIHICILSILLLLQYWFLLPAGMA